MTGATLGFAAAANFPAPFVTSGVGNVAIVYGTGAGISALDQVQAGNIQTALSSYVSGGTTTIDGESFKFEKTSTKFHLGDNITGVVSSSLDDDELPTLLASGKYIDDDNDEIDYSQKIDIGAANQLSMFENNDYVADQPTVGFMIPSSQNVLTYTLTFEDSLLITDMPTTDLPLMGKSYYVLSNTSTTLTLLDSAASTTIVAGETKTLTVGSKTYTVSASIFDTANSKVKLEINGETTNLLAATETQKLSDGAYVGVKEVVVQNFQGGQNQVEFSIGSGKLKITDSSDVQINDESISGLVGTITDSANVITSIGLAWAADEDLFIAEDNAITMPGFGAVSLSYGGLTYPFEEIVQVQQGGDTYATLENFPLKDGPVDINILYGDSVSFTGIGKDSDNLLLVRPPSDEGVTTGNATKFDQDEHDYMVVSWSDGSDAESYLVRFNNFVLDGSTNETDIQYYSDGGWVTKKAGAKDSDTVTLGNADIQIHNITRTQHSVDIMNNSANTNFNKLYSKEGLTVWLPWQNTTAVTQTNGTGYATHAAACTAFNAAKLWSVGEVYTGTVTFNLSAAVTSAGVVGTASNCTTSVVLQTKEEDENGNKGSSTSPGDTVNVTLGWDSSTTPEVEVSSVATSNADATSTEILETDVWRDFTYSALATEILYDKPTSGQDSVKLIYHGDEVAADVFISEADAVISSGGALGDVLVTDAEVASVSGKNLVIVGGSCINSAAASALGLAGHTCSEAFTAATGVGAGEFLIKGVQNSALAPGKLALVVAGYEAADTVNAATYLTMKPVDTSKTYIGTSSTEATLQVA